MEQLHDAIAGTGDLHLVELARLLFASTAPLCDTLHGISAAGGRLPTDPVLLESMMRAAHSIKSAAVIVDRQAVVGLSHAMEDVFVVAQQGRTVVDADAADTLLAAVDLMQRLAAEDDDGSADGDAAVQGHVDALAALLARPAGLPAPARLPAAASAAPVAPAAQPSDKPPGSPKAAPAAASEEPGAQSWQG